MPPPADDAVSRRDETLLRTRRASRWITVAAVTAAVGFGTAFAHAVPGHSTTAQAATSPGRAGAGAARRSGPGPGPSRHRLAAGHHGRRHHGRHHLQPPPQPPASSPAPQPPSTPTPPPVVSGGS
jgi:hypothetical protein